MAVDGGGSGAPPTLSADSSAGDTFVLSLPALSPAEGSKDDSPPADRPSTGSGRTGGFGRGGSAPAGPPGPAPPSKTSRRAGRPSRRQKPASCRATMAPNTGWTLGLDW